MIYNNQLMAGSRHHRTALHCSPYLPTHALFLTETHTHTSRGQDPLLEGSWGHLKLIIWSSPSETYLWAWHSQRLGRCRIVMTQKHEGVSESDIWTGQWLSPKNLPPAVSSCKVPTSPQGSPQPRSPGTSQHTDPSQEDSRSADFRSWTCQKREINAAVMPTRKKGVLTPRTCCLPIAPFPQSGFSCLWSPVQTWFLKWALESFYYHPSDWSLCVSFKHINLFNHITVKSC